MYAVGIDISKGKSTIAIISIDGEVIENPFEISHTQDGINTFVKKIENYKKEDVKILMEATGYYHLPLLNYLIKNNYFVCVENALVIKKYCDIDLRKVKNDKKDSLKLATYCCEKWYKLKRYEPDNDIRSNLRLLSREYSEYINIQTRLKIKLTNLIKLSQV